MIKEHVSTTIAPIDPVMLEYICRKANQHGIKGHQLVRTVQEMDQEGNHIYFEFTGEYHAAEEGEE